MQGDILASDRQSQSRSAGCSRACGICAVKTVEYALCGFLVHADAVVADADGHRVAGGANGDDHRGSFRVFHGVHQKVAHDSFDAACINFCGAALVG